MKVSQTAGEVASQQLTQIMALLPEGIRPVLTADRAYPSIPFLWATAELACDKRLAPQEQSCLLPAGSPTHWHAGSPALRWRALEVG